MSAIAAELDLSRPTVYKYMEKYDKGEREKLPREVVAYFEKKLTPKDDPKLISEKKRLEELSTITTIKADMERTRMSEILRKKEDLANEIADLKNASDGGSATRETISKMRINSKVLDEELMRCSDAVHKFEEQLSEINAALSELGDTKFKSGTAKPVFSIKSRCFIEDGKCMVVHTGNSAINVSVSKGIEKQELVYYRLRLYAKIDDEFAHLGDYVPVKGRNFFIIDDVFLSAPLYYNVVGFVKNSSEEDGDSEFKGPEGEPDLIELPGYQSTGMCELKQKK